MLSNIKHLFLTGSPGVGKTTIIIDVINAIQTALHQQENAIPSTHDDDDDDDDDDENENEDSVDDSYDDFSDFSDSSDSSNDSSYLINPPNIYIRGFYTKERRCSKEGTRIGFDIHSYYPPPPSSSSTSTSSITTTTKRATLAKISKKNPKKSDPAVGKYIVNVNNIKTIAIPSIDPIIATCSGTSDDLKRSKTDTVELIVVDEVGKMELKCEEFYPAVHRALNVPDLYNNNSSSSSSSKDMVVVMMSTMVLGTLPTPRYGRIISEVEEIRAREDVLVLHVTKANREEVKGVLIKSLFHVLGLEKNEKKKKKNEKKNEKKKNHWTELLEPFAYTRPIGASSMNGPQNPSQTPPQPQQPQKEEEEEKPPKPCGPLIHPTIKPKLLLVGETASPAHPTDETLNYSERSMWTVLAPIFGMDPINSKKIIEGDDDVEEKKRFVELKNRVLERGIAICDVLLNVHDTNNNKDSNKENKKRKRFGSSSSSSSSSKKKLSKKSQIPNDEIHIILKTNPTICGIAFIGTNAQKSFVYHHHHHNNHNMSTSSIDLDSFLHRDHRGLYELEYSGGSSSDQRFVELVTLPSSSKANTSVTMKEKVESWKSTFKDFLCE